MLMVIGQCPIPVVADGLKVIGGTGAMVGYGYLVIGDNDKIKPKVKSQNHKL